MASAAEPTRYYPNVLKFRRSPLGDEKRGLDAERLKLLYDHLEEEIPYNADLKEDLLRYFNPKAQGEEEEEDHRGASEEFE